ncbi:hypothetical protein Pcinc_044116 [Petrolisthes cinctipes]|uniref:Uncharacterized protein n=1 Tax=Petrolisthes cinctipes TaxID=88211 RepID=A0AAE1EEJ4_PETCI|nr:hypothetical protein Pcinc_044116 [Petrolisthes cinctipes]
MGRFLQCGSDLDLLLVIRAQRNSPSTHPPTPLTPFTPPNTLTPFTPPNTLTPFTPPNTLTPFTPPNTLTPFTPHPPLHPPFIHLPPPVFPSHSSLHLSSTHSHPFLSILSHAPFPSPARKYTFFFQPPRRNTTSAM